ncbi:MAG: hypothetical protein HY097_03665 [Nitrospinae bacterium]|nr:hypothetical protein [Nitrospinota bacterium]
MPYQPPITIDQWQRAIMHVDADAFFTSCEQAIHPELKGKPVIAGKERGIVAATSYKAKKRGVIRGMRLFEVKKLCPIPGNRYSPFRTDQLIKTIIQIPDDKRWKRWQKLILIILLFICRIMVWMK